MGGLLSCCACGALSCCTNAACNCCGRVIPCKSSYVTRGAYAVLFFITTILTWVLGNWGQNIIRAAPPLKEFCDTISDPVQQNACYAYFAVYRMSFALACFHFLLGIALICVKSSRDPRFFIQGGSMVAWIVKFLVWAGWIVGCFFIPNNVFYVYAWIAVFGAGIFVIVQLILLIEFAYEWNESWVGKYHGDTMEENKKWFYLLLAATALLFAGSFTLTVLMYVYYANGNQLFIFFITFNMLLCIIVCVCSILPKVQEWNPRSGLLQSAVIATYSTYLVWSAITSAPTSSTVTNQQTASSQATMIIGIILVFAAVVYSALRTGSTSMDELKGQIPSAKKHADPESANTSSEDEEEVVEVEYNYTFFHISFLLGAMYIGMLMSNWAVVGGLASGSTQLNVDNGNASVWVKIVTSWLTLLLYAWTLFAPKLLADRDFS
eukprot:TRINITY_DN481_c0_g1_i2.p1 TRINITY_DN481_c0_g1~~TRINITY_DN481_c0_g1_i2.p1  ORF type:complete len:436 (-),score=62.67 TRINITY_DN481_c0_g1_i2:100-1407(-)